MEGEDVPYRFGKGFDVSYSFDDGQWENVEGGRHWTISFKSDGAISLNFIIDNFYLPEGAKLYIENQDETVLYGPVEENNNKWGTLYKYTWPIYDVWGSYQNEVQNLKHWLNERMEWLEREYDRM